MTWRFEKESAYLSPSHRVSANLWKWLSITLAAAIVCEARPRKGASMAPSLANVLPSLPPSPAAAPPPPTYTNAAHPCAHLLSPHLPTDPLTDCTTERWAD